MERLDHSPFPWTFTYFTKPDGSEIKTPQDVADTVAYSSLQCDGTTLWGVSLDEKDEDGRTLVICYTGNGPHSEANARMIAAAVNALNVAQVCAVSNESNQQPPVVGSETKQFAEALRTLLVLARVTASGHKSGREHHPELHLCESCNSNVADLCEGIAEAERLLAERGGKQ